MVPSETSVRSPSAEGSATRPLPSPFDHTRAVDVPFAACGAFGSAGSPSSLSTVTVPFSGPGFAVMTEATRSSGLTGGSGGAAAAVGARATPSATAPATTIAPMPAPRRCLLLMASILGRVG